MEGATPASKEPTAATACKTQSAAADGGAAFVLESKGNWWHAGYHLTTAIVGPTILTLPYALRGMGWGLGLASLTAIAAVTFYAYLLMSKVLDHTEKQGRRHIRFRELAADVLGSGWMFYLVVFVQTAINTGIGIGTILLSGQCLEVLYSSIYPHGQLKLYHFIMMVTGILILLSQLPSFHSLRYINLCSLLLALGYALLVVAGCIRAGLPFFSLIVVELVLSKIGTSKIPVPSLQGKIDPPPWPFNYTSSYSRNAPIKDYSLESSKSIRSFNIFTSISIMASIFGNGILPEIQATLAPPAAKKMLKGLVMCYSVVFLTFYSVAISGYWAFGNKANSNILKSLMPDVGPSLAPEWLLGLAIVFVLLQLLAIGLVYSQVAYEIMEKNSSDVNKGIFSKRNLVPRLILRTLNMIFCAFVAAMLPFFGDIVAVVGAVGFIPLDFILPMLLYNTALAPKRNSFIYWLNICVMVVFTCVEIMGAFSSTRKLVLDASKFELFSNNVVD